MMFATLFGFLFFVIVMLLILAASSGNLFGKLLAVNVLGTVIATLIAVIGVIVKQPDYFDIALLYILLNFSTTLALLRFFRNRKIPEALLNNVSDVAIAPHTSDTVPDMTSGTVSGADVADSIHREAKR